MTLILILKLTWINPRDAFYKKDEERYQNKIIHLQTGSKDEMCYSLLLKRELVLIHSNVPKKIIIQKCQMNNSKNILNIILLLLFGSSLKNSNV